MPQPDGAELEAVRARRAELRDKYLLPPELRTVTTGRGLHHAALICADVEETIRFYQDVVGFPLVELVENRDYAGSSHFFFDLGNRNLLGFFDFPGHDHPAFQETIGGVQHIAVSVGPEQFAAARARFDAAGIDYLGRTAASRTASTSATRTASASSSTWRRSAPSTASRSSARSRSAARGASGSGGSAP